MAEGLKIAIEKSGGRVSEIAISDDKEQEVVDALKRRAGSQIDEETGEEKEQSNEEILERAVRNLIAREVRRLRARNRRVEEESVEDIIENIFG